jgi:hypothetical protein
MAAPQQLLPVPGRPLKWRVLGVLTGPTADAIVEGDQRGLGAIEEIFELPGTEAEVRSALEQGAAVLFLYLRVTGRSLASIPSALSGPA